MRRFEDKRLRDSARGQACAFRIPEVCCGNPETTVLCHDRRGLFGAGMKPHDWNGAFGCVRCHDTVDRRAKMPHGSLMTADEAAFYWNRAKVATLEFWFERGILSVTDGDETRAGGTA